MAKWIADGSIALREIDGTRSEKYNPTSGIPSFNVKLECGTIARESAIQKLLGNPEVWPFAGVFDHIYCVNVDVVGSGQYTTDADGQVLENQYVILDATYAPRVGVYLEEDYQSKPVYWLDEIEPRYESRPLPHRQFVWGDITTSLPSEILPMIDGDESPQKPEPGASIVHTIEGWQDPSWYAVARAAIGTTNAQAYTSPVLGDTFEEESLLLRNVTIQPSYSFASYRTGAKTYTLKFFYEWKHYGWNRFWRNKMDAAGYYYLRYAESPYAIYLPFPPSDHRPWLSYFTLKP